ncbi:hypothetical protein GAY28_10705 [Azospirillum brasilense]|nr:hypothetical protein [Azospirillum brasilense]
MAVRTLSQFEKDIARSLVELGKMKQWEFSAALRSDRSLIEIRCLANPEGADPSLDVRNHAAAGNPVTIHHNHLSGESLSWPDWNGLCSLSLHETFAHTMDGTIYWGQALNSAEVLRVYPNRDTLDNQVETDVFNTLCSMQVDPDFAQQLAAAMRKHIVNLALKEKGWVRYEVFWGTEWMPTMAVFHKLCAAQALQLVPSL